MPFDTSWLFFVFNIYLFIYLAALGLSCGTWGRHCVMWDLLVGVHGLSHCGTRTPGYPGSVVVPCGLWHMGSSSTRDQTCVPCVGGQILNHWTTRDVPVTHGCLQSALLPTSSPRQPFICFLYLQLCPFWTLHVMESYNIQSFLPGFFH